MPASWENLQAFFPALEITAVSHSQEIYLMRGPAGGRDQHTNPEAVSQPAPERTTITILMSDATVLATQIE